MPIDPGTRLGPYEIESPLGAGGMGEVYKARDTRLDRVVAIKVLPGHLSDRPELKERFDREAKAISNLQHPNICALFDVGHENGIDFLVMEYLEGETLAEKLEKEKLTPPQVLEIGVRVAEALDKAHRSGIVHRDLKPGNVMLTREGVKLLDFGLAKMEEAGSQAGSGSLPGLTAMPTDATPQTPLTQEGTILGTFQYMSPEQLEGKEADSRTDIFALGLLLYEMATGIRAFAGESQASVIAAIMGADPRPISEVIPMSPPALDRVVKTCMAKNPEDRWQTAHDVALQLEWIGEGGTQAGVPAPVAARRRSRERIAWALTGIAGLAAIALGTLFLMNRPEPNTQVMRFQVAPPPGANAFSYPTISPDGRYLAFLSTDTTGTSQVWVRRMDALAALPLPGTEDANRPFWSPDSRYLAYITAQGKAKKVSVQGGPPQPIGDAVGYDGTWGREGVILFDNSATDTLHMINASGGIMAPASSLDRSLGETGHVWPQFLPDGKHFLFLAVGTEPGQRILKVGELGSLESRVLGDVGSRFQYVNSGHILFVRDGTLIAQPFDVGTLQFTGEPVPLAEDVSTAGSTVGGSFSASETGILTFWAGQTAGERELLWVDREGNELAVLGEASTVSSPVLSPDQRRVLVEIEDPRTGTDDLWLRDLERGTVTRMTFDPGDDNDPAFSPDGRWVVFSSNRTGTRHLYKRKTGGGGLPDSLYDSASTEFPNDWSPDGKWIVTLVVEAGQADLIAVPADGAGEPIDIARTPFDEAQGKVSPDGKWIAYHSRESGAREVYVQAFPEPDGKWQISTRGGLSPQWREDGKELFYLTPDRSMMSVSVDTQDGFRAGVPEPLFRSRVRTNPFALNRFQVADNGQRFLMNVNAGVTQTHPVTVVLNWTAELEER